MLTPEASELLALFVETSRRLARGQREPFLISTNTIRRSHDYPIRHSMLKSGEFAAYPTDIEDLRRLGLISVRQQSGHLLVDVSPQGYEEYATNKMDADSALSSVESELRAFIDSSEMQRLFPDAIAKWRKAEELLWRADPANDFTAIGHHCREALQSFALALERKFGVANESADPTKTVMRLRAIITSRLKSATVKAFGEALLTYWGTLNDLAQRQEHGALRDELELTWQDAKRLVFQTLIAMNEVYEALRTSR